MVKSSNWYGIGDNRPPMFRSTGTIIVTSSGLEYVPAGMVPPDRVMILRVASTATEPPGQLVLGVPDRENR